MDPATTFILQLVLLAICVLAAVASAWFARKNNVRDLQDQLDILSENAEKVLRTARTARMREVRAATRADQVENSPPPELAPGATPAPSSPAEIKKALRQKYFGRGSPTH